MPCFALSLSLHFFVHTSRNAGCPSPWGEISTSPHLKKKRTDGRFWGGGVESSVSTESRTNGPGSIMAGFRTHLHFARFCLCPLYTSGELISQQQSPACAKCPTSGAGGFPHAQRMASERRRRRQRRTTTCRPPATAAPLGLSFDYPHREKFRPLKSRKKTWRKRNEKRKRGKTVCESLVIGVRDWRDFKLRDSIFLGGAGGAGF